MRQKAKWRITVDFEDGMTLFSQSPFQKEHRVTKNVCHLTHLFYLSQADLCVHRCPRVKINLGFTYDRRHSRGFLTQIRLRPHPKVPDDFQSLEETFEEILLLFLFYLRSRAPRHHLTRVLQERPPSRTKMNKQVDWQTLSAFFCLLGHQLPPLSLCRRSRCSTSSASTPSPRPWRLPPLARSWYRVRASIKKSINSWVRFAFLPISFSTFCPSTDNFLPLKRHFCQFANHMEKRIVWAPLSCFCQNLPTSSASSCPPASRPFPGEQFYTTPLLHALERPKHLERVGYLSAAPILSAPSEKAPSLPHISSLSINLLLKHNLHLLAKVFSLEGDITHFNDHHCQLQYFHGSLWRGGGRDSRQGRVDFLLISHWINRTPLNIAPPQHHWRIHAVFNPRFEFLVHWSLRVCTS